MSNFVFCGYDLQDQNSKAGQSDGRGINLNSVSVQYMLSNSPDMCRKVYTGECPSFYGSGPTISDGGTFLVNKDTGEAVQIEKGDEPEPMYNNPAVSAAQFTGQPLQTQQFSGALAPQYHDNTQPIFHASNIVGMGMNYPVNGGMMQLGAGGGYFPPPQLRQFSGVFSNRNNQQEPNYAKEEWEQYQRTSGFKAPIPTDTDFPEFGLLSGFARDFDPYQDLLPGDDDFYDVTLNGRVGISQKIHQMMLSQYAPVWGYVPGQIIDRRENMMFPGINEDHHMSFPSSNPVYNHQGIPQMRIGNQQPMMGMPANRLPVSNMVATNPYMQGVTTVGMSPMNPSMQGIPTPYMQARYNYAIANGFQSVQEMDKNDFLVLKLLSRSVHADMTDDEFAEYFDKCWCKRFTDIKERREESKKRGDEIMEKAHEIPRMRVFLMKGDKILSGIDMFEDEAGYRQHVANVKACIHKTREQYLYEEFLERERNARKDALFAFLHNEAVERKYDHAGFHEFLRHGLSEAFMRDLNFIAWKEWNSPAGRQAELGIDQTAFLRRCMERSFGFGIPAAYSRLALENRLFYVNENLPAEEYANFLRGTFGCYPNGQPLPDTIAPLYGYITIADPENPDMHIPFPRRHIKDLHGGYLKFASASAAKSKKPFHIMNYDEFSTALGVRIMDDKDFYEKYKDFEPAEKYVAIAKRGMEEEEMLNRPPHADSPNEDFLDRDDPTGDIPYDELVRQIEEEGNTES